VINARVSVSVALGMAVHGAPGLAPHRGQRTESFWAAVVLTEIITLQTLPGRRRLSRWFHQRDIPTHDVPILKLLRLVPTGDSTHADFVALTVARRPLDNPAFLAPTTTVTRSSLVTRGVSILQGTHLVAGS